MRILGEKLRDGVRIIGDHLGWGGENRGKTGGNRRIGVKILGQMEESP